MTKGFYKRGWHHTKSRGSESTVTCGFCGRRVPKYKTFPVVKGMRISDPVLRKEFKFNKSLSLLQSKTYACPACARHRNIVRGKR